MNREYIDPCPIHTLDEAILWMAERNTDIEFHEGSVSVLDYQSGKFIEREIGNGFDARGTVMMATRDLWMLLHGEAQQKQ